MISAINLYGGKIIFDDFNIDLNIPVEEQNTVIILQQDLLYIKYGDHYIIDVGWYPEGNPKGFLKIMIIENDDWDNPIFEKKLIAKDLKQFPQVLEEAAKIAADLQKTSQKCCDEPQN